MKPVEIFDCPVISLRVIDGDTQSIVLDRGWRTSLGVTTRVQGIDAPEMSTEAGRLVAGVAQKWFSEALVDPYRLRWLSHSLDMYGRSVGDFVDRLRPDESFAQYLQNQKLAVAYSGVSRRDPWTQEQLLDVVDRCRKILDDPVLPSVPFP